MFKKSSLFMLVVLLGSILACGGKHYVKDISPQVQAKVETTPVVIEEVKAEPATKEVEIPQFVELKERVLFEFDSFNLVVDAQLILKRVAFSMKDYPDTLLRIKGHACKIGTDEYNQTLSENRAGAVKEFLIETGVPADRIVSVIGFGETQLLSGLPNWESRRVIILSAEE